MDSTLCEPVRLPTGPRVKSAASGQVLLGSTEGLCFAPSFLLSRDVTDLQLESHQSCECPVVWSRIVSFACALDDFRFLLNEMCDAISLSKRGLGINGSGTVDLGE
jgi:hypothetical protein